MQSRNWRWGYAWLALAGALVACGGGGGDDAPTAAASLTLSGTAATGAAISNQTVDIKCASGTGTGTTATNGSFSISISGGALPCLARVTTPAGVVLHTVITGSSSTANANITPVTQLVVASLSGTDPAAYFSTFNGTAAIAVTSTALSAAKASVVAILLAAGVDLGPAGDVISGTLTPSTSTTAGNAYDIALDALAAKLASSGTTLATLTTTVATSSTVAVTGVPTASATASLPADLLLKPSASNCAALRSGTYRVVKPVADGSLSDQTTSLMIDAVTLAVVFGDGSAGHWTANGPCRFLGDNHLSDIVVSPAGVVVARDLDSNGTTYHVHYGFPEQTHTLAELAGEWNFTGLERNAANTGYTGVIGTYTLDANGMLTAASGCKNDATWGLTGADCASFTGNLGATKPNSSGGFDLTYPGETAPSSRLFAYRAGGGELMVVQVDDDGSVSFRTRQRVNALPVVAAVSTVWNATNNNQLLSGSAVDATNIVIKSVDDASKTYVRTSKTIGGTNDHDETLAVNNPRDGFFFRAAGSSLAANGSTVNFQQFTGLSLRGMGLSMILFPSSKLFVASVNQP